MKSIPRLVVCLLSGALSFTVVDPARADVVTDWNEVTAELNKDASYRLLAATSMAPTRTKFSIKKEQVTK
jgi:hypothetical protein